ncbi:MAG: Tlg2-vesicle protein [Trichoglossum hirsutum]|nr:MAG: Tlg2-vesicle protein [Trichoglossum hirsutum]
MSHEDYTSTARALALPVSPPGTPSDSRAPLAPPWSRTRSTSGHRRSHSFSRSSRGFKEDLMKNADKLQRKIYAVVRRMSWWQRIASAIVLVVLAVLGILFLVFSERIFGSLVPVAVKWRNLKAGWLIAWTFSFICAFPPVIGYSTSVTVAGFVYGFPNGWFITASSTVVGSFSSFVVSRTLLSGYVHRLVANDKRFTALALTLKHDGLKLLVMIRFCPLPYSLSNGAMSTFPTIRPLEFALATVLSTPKLLIHVFVGAKLYELAEKGAKMDARTKAINYISIVGGGVIGVVTGWLIYQRTVARARQLEAEERAKLRDSAREDVRVFSDDPEQDAFSATLLSDDDLTLFEDGLEADAYRDDFTDDDIFGQGGGDGDEDISLVVQEPHRASK